MTDGLVNVLKPPGLTSHDVVGILRRIYKTKKIGHAGTLDPEAAGVLPSFIGSATRLLEYAVDGYKCYRAEVTLGVQTDTGDDSGKVIKTAPVPELDEAALQAVLTQFTGDIMQIPPMYSALKFNGRKLYQYARQGIEIEREPRPVHINKLTLLGYTDCTFSVRVECSKGTYIRTLLEDMAVALGTCGMMTFLLRERVGDFTVAAAHTIEEIEKDPDACLLPVVKAVEHLPRLEVNPLQACRITDGVKTTVIGTENGVYALYVRNISAADELRVSLEAEVTPISATTTNRKDTAADQYKFLGVVKAEDEIVHAVKILNRPDYQIKRE